MHHCPVGARERWFPLGASCVFCRQPPPVADCRAVGFTGEGRCIESAGPSGYCAEHAKCQACGEVDGFHSGRGECRRRGYEDSRFTFPEIAAGVE